MPTYGPGTKKIIKELQQDQVKMTQETTVIDGKTVHQTVLTTETGNRLVLPSKKELAELALRITDPNSPFDINVDGKILAEQGGINTALLYHIRNDNRPHTIRQDIVLCAVLLRTDVPNTEDTRDLLKKNRCKDLYLNTCKRSENRRHYVLSRCLDYANEKKTCPVKDWLYFTNGVIYCLNRRLSDRLGQPLDLLVANPPDADIESQLPTDFLDALEAQLPGITGCKPGIYRAALLEAYKKKMGLTTNNQAQQQLSSRCYCDASGIRNVFSASSTRPGGRDLLINAAIAMGCSLEETNLLLRQADQPILYPSGVFDGEDAESVNQLSRVPLLPEEEFQKYLMSK